VWVWHPIRGMGCGRQQPGCGFDKMHQFNPAWAVVSKDSPGSNWHPLAAAGQAA
jgi:hypothetical protein